MRNPKVFLSVRIGPSEAGRIVIELFPECVDEAVENFRGLCTGEYGAGPVTRKPLSYAGCKVYEIEPGIGVKFGDFVCNDGSSGESVYGGSARPQNFSNRHTQAGVVSLICTHTDSGDRYDSRFIITTKNAKQLEGKAIAIGQVRAGMEIIRAIQQIPIDARNRPRVAVIISDCGELSAKEYNFIMASRISEPKTALLQGQEHLRHLASAKPKPDGAVDASDEESGTGTVFETRSEEALDSDSSEETEQDESEVGTASAPPSDSRAFRFDVLKARVEQSKQILKAEGLETSPNYSERFSKREDNKRRRGEKGDAVFLSESALLSELGEDKRLRKEQNKLFGWDVFNTDAQIRAHEKRLKDLLVNEAAYEAQKAGLGSQFYNPSSAVAVSADHIASSDGKARLVEDLEKRAAAKAKFNRRRRLNDDLCDVDYINDRNRQFNTKLDRAYGQYSIVTKQNLERGTAL